MSQDNARQALTQLRQQAQTHWASMAPRERQISTVALVLLLLTLLVMTAVRPAWRSLRDTPIKLQEVQTQLDQMRRLADEAVALRARPAVPQAQAEAALQAASERLGKGVQLSLQGERATLNITRVSGEALAAWLEEVRAAARAKPAEARLNQIEPGVYAGTLVLTLAAAPGPR